MSSIVKPYRKVAEVENSPLFEKLRKKGEDYITSASFDQKRVHSELTALFRHGMHLDYFITLITPWLNTLQWLGIVNKVNLSTEKELWLDPILQQSKKLRSTIGSWLRGGDTPSIYAFLEAEELSLGIIIDGLNKLESIVQFCKSDMDFARGTKYSPDKIKQYGVFALFHLAENLGLKHAKKNSQIFKFVKIITGLKGSYISDCYAQYNGMTIEILNKDNWVFDYIYNPKSIVKKIQNKLPYIKRCPYSTFVTPVSFTAETPNISDRHRSILP